MKQKSIWGKICSFFLFVNAFVIYCLGLYGNDVLLNMQFNQLEEVKTYIQGQAPTFVAGISGEALQLQQGTLALPAPRNIHSEQGTVAFWIKPVNWSSMAEREEFIPIFAIDKKQGKNWSLLLYFYNKGNGQRMLSLRSKVGGTFSDIKTMYAEVRLPKDQFAQGAWTYVTISWDNLGLNLYLDGKNSASRSYGMALNMRDLDKQDKIWLMPIDFWKRKNLEKWKTDIDSLQIFSDAMTADGVRELYSRQKKVDNKFFQPSLLTIPKSKRAVNIDGILLDKEWEDASKVPLMKMNQNRMLNSEFKAWAYLKHDERFLYIGYDIENYKDSRNPAKENTFDRKVFSGAHVEFLCRLPGKEQDSYFQFALAPNNAFACRSQEGGWEQAFEFEHQATSGRENWQAEMKIPLSKIGLAFPQKKLLHANLGLYREAGSIDDRFNRWFAWSTANDKGETGAYYMTMGKIILSEQSLALRIEELNGLEYGDLLARLSSAQNKVNWKIALRSIENTEEIKKEESAKAGSWSYSPKIDWKGTSLLTIAAFSSGNEEELLYYDALSYIRDPWAFEADFFSDQNEFKISVNIGGLQQTLGKALSEGLVTANINLVRVSDQKIIAEKQFKLNNIKDVVIFKPGTLDVGKYQLKVTLNSPGKDFVKTKDFERPSDVFLKDKKGLERAVPKPWSGLSEKDAAVATKFHKYTFGEGPFPLKAWSQGHEVMSSCSGLLCKVQGNYKSFVPQEKKRVETLQDRIITHGTARLESLPELLMDWTRTIYYDGMIRVDITLKPTGKPVKIDGMRVNFQIPLKEAKYAMMPRWQEEWNKIKEGQIRTFPLAWLTGTKVGFCLFTDNDANWMYGTKEPLKIIKTATHAELEAEIIEMPVVIDKAVTYVLAVMATPARPPRKDFRNIHFDGWGRVAGQTLQSRGWPSDCKKIQWKRSWLPTEILNAEAAKKAIAEYKAKGIGCVQYSMTGIPDNNSIYDYYGNAWRNRVNGMVDPKHTPMKDIDGTPYYFCAHTSTNNSDYRDFVSYYVDKMLKDFDFMGYYIDGSSCQNTDIPYKNTNLSDAFMKRKYVRNYDIFGRRNLSERLYKIIHSHRPNGFFVGHSWDNFWPPIVGFYDLGYPGEEFMHSFPSNNNAYIEETPLEKWQSNYNSNAMGIGMQFLPQLRFVSGLMNLPGGKRFEKSRTMWLCCLLHDVPVSGTFYSGAEFIWPIMDEHKVSDATFYGYWEQDQIKSNNSSVKVSYYSWSNSDEILLIIGNTSKNNQKANLKFSPNLAVSFHGTDQLGDLNFLNSPPPKNVSVNNPMKIDNKKAEIDLRNPLEIEGYGFKIITMSCKHGKFKE